jgi:Outer membrane protein beta-barrel domain
MKKILVVILLAVVSSSAFSQAQLALGIKGGLNFANVNVTNTNTAYNSRTGYHAGAFFLIKLSKIGIQPEILFSRQGTSTKVNTTDLNSNFDYINIPVIIKLYTVAGINIQVGPQIGFLAGAKADQGTLINGNITNITSVDIKDQLKGSDFSAALGLGWDAPFGLTVDARYNLGLSNVNNNTSSTSEAKNQVIQVSVGFKLLKFGK